MTTDLEKTNKSQKQIVRIANTDKWLEPHNIVFLREYLQLTQVEFSKVLGLAPKSFSKYETGRSRPSKATRVLMSLISEQPFLILEISPAPIAMAWKFRIGKNSCGRLLEEYQNYLKTTNTHKPGETNDPPI